MPTYCSFDPQHGPAGLIVTNLVTGDAVTPCPDCAPFFLATMVQAMGFEVTDRRAEQTGEPEPEPGGDGSPEQAGTGPESPAEPSAADHEGDGPEDAAATGSAPPIEGAEEAHVRLQEVTGGIP